MGTGALAPCPSPAPSCVFRRGGDLPHRPSRRRLSLLKTRPSRFSCVLRTDQAIWPVMVRWLGIVLGTLRSTVRTHRELALEARSAPSMAGPTDPLPEEGRDAKRLSDWQLQY